VCRAVSADVDGSICRAGVVWKSDRQPAANVSYWSVPVFCLDEISLVAGLELGELTRVPFTQDSMVKKEQVH